MERLYWLELEAVNGKLTSTKWIELVLVIGVVKTLMLLKLTVSGTELTVPIVCKLNRTTIAWVEERGESE
jgi:hypothetical protein